MPRAEIIAIGTELLLGEIQDTNTRWIARQLRDVGIDIFRATIIGDNATRIAQVIRESLERCDILITTGGLGPTVDDPTREAVALATDGELEFHPELWIQIQQRFKRYKRPVSENNRQQAFIPAKAIAIENPVGTAPAFYLKSGKKVIFCLPGVPHEMETLMADQVLPYLKKAFRLQGGIYVRVLHVTGVGESQVDEWIGDLEKLANPTVGLMAHPGMIDIRIAAKAGSPDDAEILIKPIETLIRSAVGDNCYGADQDSLEGVVALLCRNRNLRLEVLEYHTDGELLQHLQTVMACRGTTSSDSIEPKELAKQVRQIRNNEGDLIVMGVSLVKLSDRHDLHLSISTPWGDYDGVRGYGGPPSQANSFAINAALDFVRRQLIAES
jgi:competence/damage-inducible protein CinA-like protein